MFKNSTEIWIGVRQTYWILTENASFCNLLSDFNDRKNEKKKKDQPVSKFVL